MKALTIASLYVVVACVVLGNSAGAQTMLELNDQLPPYLLSARLLNNGHFSITTNYTTDTTKTLIYREDGAGNRPVNYTSHVHIKIDDVVYQLPYEIDRTTDLPPPPNPLIVQDLFRDTVQGRPRINTRLLAIPSAGDSVKLVFTMEPVQRPSGGFIRLSVRVDNSGIVPHSIGVLMLVDTKIGKNDRAPIGTAFGYSGIESQYRRNTAPGIPEFWIALEGTPLAPGLTARGNLRASELIEPDRFLFGNWVDDNSTGIPGLYKVMWDERIPSGLSFTDSAILLLWEQQKLAARTRKLLAATEIGLVDSLSVSFGTGGGGGGSGGGGGGSLGVAGPGGCMRVATVIEDTCGKAGYSPYAPDTVTSLFLVTNTGQNLLNNVRVELGALPAGIRPLVQTTQVIPAALTVDQTGVGLASFEVVPRLYDQTYTIPIAFMANASDTILQSTVCVIVPGILGKIDGANTVTLPVCPGNRDTFDIPVKLDGIRCLPMYRATVIAPSGAPASIVGPLPVLPANGSASVQIESAPLSEQQTDVYVQIVVRDWESLAPGDTTWVELIDTVKVTIVGKHAEVQALTAGDTLVLPRICVRDTMVDSMQIQNVGGCDATITNARLSNDAGGVFTLNTKTVIPQTIARGARGQLFVQASSAIAGTFVGEIEFSSPAKPVVIRVPVKIEVDKPAYSVQGDTLYMDTICTNATTAKSFDLANITGCDILIDSVRILGTDPAAISPQTSFLVGPKSTLSISVAVTPVVQGAWTSTFRIFSAEGGNRDITVVGYSADKSLNVTDSIYMGRQRVSQNMVYVLDSVVISNNSQTPLTITGVQYGGQNPTDATLELPGGQPWPITILPLQGQTCFVTSRTQGIGERRTLAILQTREQLCAPILPVTIVQYGVQPLLDIERHDIQKGSVCYGGVADTTVTIRNIGNEALSINKITCTGSNAFTLPEPLPIRLDSGEEKQLAIRLSPTRIGPDACECTVQTNADWFTVQDTTLRIGIVGVVCGTLWADTVDAMVGTVSEIPIYLQPDERTTLTQDSLFAVLASQGTLTEFEVRTDSSMARFTTDIQGLISGTVQPVPGSAYVSGVPAVTGTVNELARLSADILLGSRLRSPIIIKLNTIAGGYFDIRTKDGLLRADYCAFDQRRVTPVQQGVQLYTYGADVSLIGFESGTVLVQWHTLQGDLLSSQEMSVSAGETVSVPVPNNSHGVLFVTVTGTNGVVQRSAVVHLH